MLVRRYWSRARQADGFVLPGGKGGKGGRPRRQCAFRGFGQTKFVWLSYVRCFSSVFEPAMTSMSIERCVARRRTQCKLRHLFGGSHPSRLLGVYPECTQGGFWGTSQVQSTRISI